MLAFFYLVLQSKKSSEQKPNSLALQEKLNPIEAEEFDANEKDENAEYYEEADEMESNIDNLSECVPNSVIVDDGVLAAKSGGKPYESKKKSDMQKSLLPEVSWCHIEIIVVFVYIDFPNH